LAVRQPVLPANRTKSPVKGVLEGVALWRGGSGGRRSPAGQRTRSPNGLKAVWGPPRRVRLGCIGRLRGRSREAPPAAGNNPNPSQAWGGVTELRCLVCEVIPDCGPKGLAYATPG